MWNTNGFILCSQFTFIFMLYFQIYVEYVVKNPLTELGEPITSELFRTKLDEYIRGLPFFTPKSSWLFQNKQIQTCGM